MMGIDAIVALLGLVIPPAVDFIKKKFIPAESDTPERTMGTLATSKPEILPEYVKSLAIYFDSLRGWFNRDVTGSPSQWVTDLRASIRPLAVVCSFLILAGMIIGSGIGWVPADSLKETITGIRLSCVANISAWIGDRISISGIVR